MEQFKVGDTVFIIPEENEDATQSWGIRCQVGRITEVLPYKHTYRYFLANFRPWNQRNEWIYASVLESELRHFPSFLKPLDENELIQVGDWFFSRGRLLPFVDAYPVGSTQTDAWTDVFRDDL